MTSIILNGNSADKLHHPISVVLVNEQLAELVCTFTKKI